MALTIRARIRDSSGGDTEQAERDAHDALACGADVKAYLGLADVFEILAGLAGDAGSHREAARLFGAADGIRQRTGEVRLRIYQCRVRRFGAGTSKRDGRRSDFEAAWAEGAALSTDRGDRLRAARAR